MAADRRRFHRALRYSALGDGGEPPKTYSPLEIESETGIPLHVQYEFFIVVSKDRALDFLAGLGYSPQKAAFKKRTTEQAYKKTFGKTPAKVGNKLVFSYLEILRLEKLTMLIDVGESDDEV